MKAPGLEGAALKRARKQEKKREAKRYAQMKKDFANGCSCMPYNGGMDTDPHCKIHGTCPWMHAPR